MVMLKATHVTKKFGELIAVNDLSFNVRKGQIFGIAGPNGAGKSTIFNLITGNYPYEGKIRFEGRNIKGLPPYRIARAGIARTFQIPQIFPSLTVNKSISVGSRFGSHRGLDPSHVEKIITFVGLDGEKRQKTGRLNLLGKKKLMTGAVNAYIQENGYEGELGLIKWDKDNVLRAQAGAPVVHYQVQGGELQPIYTDPPLTPYPASKFITPPWIKK